MWAKHRHYSGFTIVELLIVIVVIAILAAITIVAYNGIQDRAKASTASQALSNAIKKIKYTQAEIDSTAAPTCAAFSAALGVSTTDCTPVVGNTSFQYTQGPNQGVNGVYCITATVGNKSYKQDNTMTVPLLGGCSGHGQGGVAAVSNLVTNPSFRLNTVGWSGSNATITRVASPWSVDGNGALQVTATGQDSFAQATIPVQAGQVYTMLGTVNLQTAQTGSFQGSTQQRNIFAAFHDSGGAYVGTGGGVSSVPANTPGTYQQRVTATAPAGSTQLRVRYYNGASSGNTVYWDQIMIVSGSYNSAYADGETTDWTWTNPSSPNDSTSIGPPQ